MRYHTTLKDIAISVLVLVSCAILTLWGMVYLDMRNPSRYLSDYLISSLAQSGSFTFSATGIERTFLRDLTILNPSLEKDEKVLASAEEGTIKGGLPLLVQSVMQGNKRVSLELEEVQVQLDESSSLSQSGNESSELISRWLQENTFQVHTDSLEGTFSTSAFTVDISQAAFNFEMQRGDSLPSLQARAGGVSLQIGSTDVALEETILNLNRQGAFSFTSSQSDLTTQQGFGSMENLVAQGSISGFNLPTDVGLVSLSAANVDAQLPSLSFSIPEFSGTVSLEQGRPQLATLSFDEMIMRSNQMEVYAPTTTLQGSWSEGQLSLGAATKEGEPLTFILDTLSLDSDNLILNARYQSEGENIEASVLLNQITYQRDDLTARLDSVSITGDAQLKDTVIESASASMTSSSTFSVLSEGIEAASPLTSTVRYEKDRSALSASLTFEELISSFTDGPLYTRLAYQGNVQGVQLQGELSLDERFNLLSVYNLPEEGFGSLHISSRMDEFPLSFLSPTVFRYASFLQPYYDEATNLTGNISFQSETGQGSVMPFDGTLAIDLALRQMKIGKVETDAGFIFQGYVERDVLDVEALTIATSGYRLVYTGKTDLYDWLPSGQLDLFRSFDGQLLGSINFFDEPPKQYRFKMTTPFEQSLFIEGIVSSSPQNLLIGDAQLGIFDMLYPFSFLLQTSTLQLSIKQEEAFSLSMNLAPPIVADISSNGLILPNRGFFANAMISGDTQLAFNDSRNWSIESELLSIGEVVFQGHTYTLQTPVSITQESITLSEMLLTDEQGTEMKSTLSYRGADFLTLATQSFLAPFDASFTLESNNERRIAISLMGEEQRISTVVKLAELPLDRFSTFSEGVVVNLDILGYTNLKQTISADGLLQVRKGEGTFSTKIEASDTTLNLFDSRFSQGDISYAGNLLLINGNKALSEGVFSHIRKLTYKDQQSKVNYTLALDLGKMETLFDLPSALAPIREGRAKAVLSLSDILLYGEGGIADGVYALSLDNPRLSIESDLLSFNYDLTTQHIMGAADPAFGIGFSVQGSLAEEDFALLIEDIHFPLNMLNRTFLKPVFGFLDGIAEGEVFVGGSKDSPRLYGQVSVNSSRMELFWLPEDIITMKNITATLDGTRAITPNTPFFSTNKITGKTVEGYGNLGANFDGLRLLNYEIHADSGNEMLYVWIPMQGFDVDIRTYAGGTFNLFGVGFETWLDGEVTIQDTTISLGIKDLPYWYVANNLTTTDFSVVTGRNVSFFYPNTPNPFIQATITENQNINFTYDHITDEFVIDGNLSFRSGEFYYFQKNFFITEGNLSLHTDALSGQNTIQPTINLRAKLTDFDAQGNRVDIFLVLRESSLTNLNPQFESTPPKDVNEILEILGQSILPTGAYGQVNLYSVASLAAAATDVAERLGYLQTSQSTLLTDSIRISLGLDMFSIRSNILQNILIDALPGGSLANLSPLARYLNNTTIFMGKYVGEQFFLQALVHLTATDGTKATRTFISPDLSLDLELSLDWQNPIGTFSFFTQPNELSFINILDTIGFSVTRRFVLR
ncbi:hypothetical protein [uncultured Sphaerochaeta sp.]|uniref:hypothetical protein n=1 Tax=uncultured Sphaerochaeta sp. TaxID=886478 RepID=UPI002AA73B74|nr:hypothetical protein [uncultured Sphaerochaeta sp.]